MDLSPREVVPTAVGRKRKRPVAALVVLGLVLVGGGVMVAKFLTSAVDYYCNVDEVGVKDGCDVGRNIRVQGVVQKGTLAEALAAYSMGSVKVRTLLKDQGMLRAHDFRYARAVMREARRLKELEEENQRLKRLVADQALDIQILKEVNSKKW